MGGSLVRGIARQTRFLARWTGGLESGDLAPQVAHRLSDLAMARLER